MKACMEWPMNPLKKKIKKSKKKKKKKSLVLMMSWMGGRAQWICCTVIRDVIIESQKE